MSMMGTVPAAVASVFHSWILLVLVSLVKNFTGAEEDGASLPPPPVFALPWEVLVDVPPQELTAIGMATQVRRISLSRGFEKPEQVAIENLRISVENFAVADAARLFSNVRQRTP